ncbi:hypothetical protein Vadar_001341 [Vaccinium darrowii]|uniref:Uncharacterized protein n=1 Tax=Vaccinium darrowii TaxID=229202 RepID=A0ACB7Z1G6_9ERIC|nr:hypothetical protein Vadar_001341 [Vaccinium darrowii]
MQTLYSYLSLSHFRSKILHSKPNYTSFLYFFSSVSSLAHTRTSNPSISNFLIETLAFSESQAISISNRFPPTKTSRTLEKPHSVVQFLRQLGFSYTQIRSSIRLHHYILFSDVDKTLKPKLQFFQNLGLTGPDLSKFISKNPRFLRDSLERTVIPCVDVIKNTLVNDKNNKDLILVLQRSYWATAKPALRLKSNIAFLESCGIVGSQLSMLLKREPWLFFLLETSLRGLVSRVIDMGFSVDSRMLVHAVHTVSCMTDETISKKFELFRSFGFSVDECMQMFRRAPRLFAASEGKLKFGMEFFLYDVKLERSVLVSRPTCLTYSMGERVIPRYRVLQVIKCKRLLKKVPSLHNVMHLTEEKFIEKFVSRFTDDAEELLVAYRGDPEWNRKSLSLVDCCV